MIAGDPNPTGRDFESNRAPELSGSNVRGYNENQFYANELERQIKTQRTNLLIAGGFTLSILAVSLLATWYLFRTAGVSGTPLEYMKLGPVAISGIALPLPLRMFLSYRTRIPVYESYKRRFDLAAATGRPAERDLVEDARAALKALHKPD
ncbi:MAG: hypothetical protein ACXW18_05505 [Pyrinomonadaceae bacterium]